MSFNLSEVENNFKQIESVVSVSLLLAKLLLLLAYWLDGKLPLSDETTGTQTEEKVVNPFYFLKH